MRFSYNWLREFLPTDLSPQELAKHLLLLGFEVSDIHALGPNFEGVIIGQILEVQKHPNADRLSLCSVSDGKETLSIVCGASNVSAGIRVPVARIGAKLPGGRTIERAKIRGTESQGMICSAVELGLPETKENGILILPQDTPLGIDATTLLGEKDWAMEIEITPNRPDCLSHLGLAKELSIHFGVALKLPASSKLSPGGEPSKRVDIQAKDACRRYTGREFHNLRIGPSPAWMAKRLEAVGVRSINNLVDVTNYVLHEMGHPLHAFDLATLKGDSIVVRFAKSGEKLKALDDKEYTLSPEDLVIADASGPLAIAGVIGGVPTSVTNKTTQAFLESAQFRPGTVRRTARKLGIRTDSSFIFERGTSPESAAAAAERAAQLIVQLCADPGKSNGGSSVSKIVDVYPDPVKILPIEITTARINDILGTDLPATRIEPILKSMAAEVESKGSALLFYPSANRLDLATQEDLAEEVARHVGYDAIPDVAAPVRPQRPESLASVELTRSLRTRLSGLGFSEAFNYDFVSSAQLSKTRLSTEDPKLVSILNPLSEDQAFLRPTLLVGLLQSAAYNISRGNQSFGLFEIGRAYESSSGKISEHPFCAGIIAGEFPTKLHWDSSRKPKQVDFYGIKGFIDEVLRLYSANPFKISDAAGPLFHPKAALRYDAVNNKPWVEFGLLHPTLLQRWDIPEPAAAFILHLDAFPNLSGSQKRFNKISAFPSVTRDLSFIVDESISYSKIQDCFKNLENLSEFDLIDIYTGKGIPEGKKSFTLRITFVRQDRTLRDEEIDKAMADAQKSLEKDCGAKLRT